MRFCIYLLLLLPVAGSAQIATFNEKHFDKLKSATLYIPMTDTVNEFAAEMVQAIRSAWKMTPIVFVHPQDLKQHYKPGRLFVTLEHNGLSFQYVRHNAHTGQVSRSAPVDNDYFYLDFWVLDDTYKEGKAPDDKSKIPVARAEMYLKSIGTGKIDYSRPDLSSERLGKEFCNGLPGYVHNIFQTVSRYISNNTAIRLKKDMDAAPGLAALKKDTLYVPNYWYGEGGTMVPQHNDQSASGKYIRKMMEDYPYPIKMVRRDVLSEMILNATRPIYYLNYIQSSADKMISVVNGQTGEILFYNFNDKSYRPKASDFKDLGQQISNL